MTIFIEITWCEQKRIPSDYYLGAKSSEFWVILIIVLVESAHILAVADEPVDGGEVFTLGELLVQPPEHLDDTEGRRGHGVGEITTGW